MIAAQQRAELQQSIDLDRQRERAEKERLEQIEKERQVENFMLLRLIKTIISANRRLEDVKVSLFSHKLFNLRDSFAMFDLNSSGRVSVNELANVFGDHNISIDGLDRLVEIVDLDDDGTIELDEWEIALKPAVGQPQSNVSASSPYLSLEQKNLFTRAWVEQLAQVFTVILDTDAELSQKRQELRLDGARLFEEMDQRNLGFISVNCFADWVSENCGYNIADEELPGLEVALDGKRDYRITRQGFIEAVSAVSDEPEPYYDPRAQPA